MTLLITSNAGLSWDTADDRVIENKGNKRGEVENIASGAARLWTLNPKPGSDTMICNVNGHYVG